MHDRSALGPADVSDEELAALVADLLGAPDVRLVSSTASSVPYDIPAITTAGRYLVEGEAEIGGERRPFALFVKHVQEWSRSPYFAAVPEEIRDVARAAVPWRTEGAVYRSDLAAHLPEGLSMPRALAVRDLDESSYAVWLELVPTVEAAWDLTRDVEAAELLGRFAATPGVRGLAGIGGHDVGVRSYAAGRLTHQVLPTLRDEGIWHHPLVASSFGPLRARLLDAADRMDALVEEVLGLPELVAHGDACSNNLLVRPDRPGFTLIDFGYLAATPVGFDLNQLLVGDIQIGRRPVDDVAERHAACLAAYGDGLTAAGTDLPSATVARSHALTLLLYTGLSSLPVEVLGQDPTPAVRDLVAARAEIARFSLDLVDATG
ncbi:aminoglycoside phosphotransferase family protein [Nocardioides stalactiti]|uniref:aminoglycoside phosphotransferase family protein n=1 Tax=Nocardioides stalactiti TaxID=2755356 RepID=UPI001600F952|nr:aminoglycoside phosphotransferase family protein [Nocardioides stalactiti]